jgi:hypothetical protein
MTDRIWTCPATGGVRFDPPPADQPGWVEWAPVAWMAGQSEAKASLSDRITELKTQAGFARIDADQQRARAEAAEAALEAAEAAPDDVAELLERAELARNEMEDEGHYNHAQVLNEAAAIVNAQWREACRLHWRLETAHCALRSVEKDELAARERAEAAEANVARLRDAIVYATTELDLSARDMPAMRAERRLHAAIRALPRQHPAPGNQGGKGGDDE